MLMRRLASLWRGSVSIPVFSLTVLVLFGCAGRIFAACNLGCVLFAAGSVTNQLDGQLKVQYYQLKNDCWGKFNSTQAANNMIPNATQVANQWRPVTANLDCDPTTVTTGSTLSVTIPGQGNTPTNPGAYTDIKCAQKCVNPS
jgi:hypothetical protein